MLAPRRLVLAVALPLLLAAWCVQVAHQNPVQPKTGDRPRYNQTCITENLENGTVIISSSMVTGTDPNQQSPTAQFNERRRDMFFEDYNIKQVEIIDTSVVNKDSPLLDAI